MRWIRRETDAWMGHLSLIVATLWVLFAIVDWLLIASGSRPFTWVTFGWIIFAVIGAASAGLQASSSWNDKAEREVARRVWEARNPRKKGR